MQIADFLAGTLAKVYEGKKHPALYEKYLELLAQKALSIDEWPTKFQTYFEPDTSSNESDLFIFKHSLAKAEVFISDKSASSDEDTQMQVCALQKLVFQCRWGAQASYITAPEIIDHLKKFGYEKASEQHFRSSIVAKLRDSDVIIASCNKGYKIPTSYNDLNDYVERVNSLVVPYLARMKKARGSYLQASNGEIDLLKGVKYPTLVKLIEQVEE